MSTSKLQGLRQKEDEAAHRKYLLLWSTEGQNIGGAFLSRCGNDCGRSCQTHIPRAKLQRRFRTVPVRTISTLYPALRCSHFKSCENPPCPKDQSRCNASWRIRWRVWGRG